ncbi:FAD-dependent oxidoreductase [Massilibacteroides vaginae]|uniref:FAD-dependent oxidoreductase n=1 Tax=Massilibacteroides vaginae TaxID=1673718 RepID=UPI000A1C83CF|nr:FAD-dependent oxidoreductase [Massilibacteroides vaginae]
MKRRSAIKTLGALSLLGTIPVALHANSTSHSNNKLSSIKTDILVVGGGTAGAIAALQAARLGSKTVLIENGSQLGGTTTTGGVCFPGLFHAWGKQVINGIGWELISETVELNSSTLPNFSIPFGKRHPQHQILINPALYSLLTEEKCIKAGVEIRYYETPLSISRKANTWQVEIAGKGTHHIISAKQIIDCTGNALITSMIGHKLLREDETQPGSLIFELDGFDISSLDRTLITNLFQSAINDGTLLSKDAYGGVMGLLTIKNGLATQHVMGADSTTSVLHTKANIEGRASMLRILRFIRTLPGCENAYIKKMQPETAIRETYRIDGLYKITHEDYISGKIWYDSLSYSYYPIDLHVEEGVKPKHLQEGVVATIPLRSLIPKESNNLIVAGRCVCSDRLANSALRVQASCMGMGQVAGATAALACKQNTTPHKVPLEQIKSTLNKHGAIIPNKNFY